MLHGVTLGVGQEIDSTQSFYGEGLIWLILVVKPVRSVRANAKVPFYRSPFLVQDTGHLRCESGDQGLPENDAQQHQQDCEKEDVAEGQAKPQSAGEPQSLADATHDCGSACPSPAFSGVSSIYPMPRTVWIILTGNLSSILLRK